MLFCGSPSATSSSAGFKPLFQNSCISPAEHRTAIRALRNAPLKDVTQKRLFSFEPFEYHRSFEILAQSEGGDWVDDFLQKKLGRGEIFYGPRSTRKSSGEDNPPEVKRRTDAVLVAGATGSTGVWVVLKLLEAGIPVRCAVRSKAKAVSMFGPDGKNLDIFVSDVTKIDTLEQAITSDVTAVVSALGTRLPIGPSSPEKIDYEGIKNLVDAAKAAGSVKHFVLISSVGVTRPDDYPLYKLFGNILYWKRAAEDYLRASGIPYTIIRPAGLTDDEGGLKRVVFRQGDQVQRGSVPRMDVAQVCVSAIQRGPEGTAGLTFEVLAEDEVVVFGIDNGFEAQWDSLQTSPSS